MKRVYMTFAVLLAMSVMAGQANGGIISVTGPDSSTGLGFSPQIIAAPSDILDDLVTNTRMQGFNEAQGVVTTVAHSIDGGGSIPIGTTVNSHMIFLNSAGNTALSHFNVVWTFANPVIGVMSDGMGDLEDASTFELGNPLTNYTTVGLNKGAPYTARGMEGNPIAVGPNGGNDGYLVSGNTIAVGMYVTEPGDWIRVVTTPAPGAVLLGMLGLSVAGVKLRKHA